MIVEILNICMTKECRVWTIKDNYRLGDDIQSKVKLAGKEDLIRWLLEENVSQSEIARILKVNRAAAKRFIDTRLQ